MTSARRPGQYDDKTRGEGPPINRPDRHRLLYQIATGILVVTFFAFMVLTRK
jgi:hypothetical protein